MKVLFNRSNVWMAAATLCAGLACAGAAPLQATPTKTIGGAYLLAGPAGASSAGAGYVQSRDWDADPPELDEVARHGFHDGIEGARKDYDHKRRPDVHDREEFRHPHVPERDREAYRRGFERGYQVGVDHLYHDHDRDHDHDNDHR